MVWEINCDETCIEDEHDFMAVGGVAAARETMVSLNAGIDRWREKNSIEGKEFKWKSAARGKQSAYREFAQGGMNWIMQKRLVVFAAAGFENEQIDTERYHDGNENLQLYRFMYLMILNKLVPHVPPGENIAVYPDARKMANYSLSDLQSALNNGIFGRHGYQRNYVVSVEPVDSKDSNPGQLADVFAGAVGFHFNRRDELSGSSRKKIALASEIAALAGCVDLRTSTPRGARFAIWKVDLTKSAKKNAPKPT